MNDFTFDKAAKAETLKSNSILRVYEEKMMLTFVEMKSNEPKLTQKEISEQMRTSDTTKN